MPQIVLPCGDTCPKLCTRISSLQTRVAPTQHNRSERHGTLQKLRKYGFTYNVKTMFLFWELHDAKFALCCNAIDFFFFLFFFFFILFTSFDLQVVNLSVDNNYNLTHIPEEIEEMRMLERANFSYNRLLKFPGALFDGCVLTPPCGSKCLG